MDISRYFGSKNQEAITDLSRYTTLASTKGANHLTDRYKFVNTQRIIETMDRHNWKPYIIQEMRTNKEINKGFQKHLIRFRNPAIVSDINMDTIYPEIVLLNSHNGTSALNFMLGIFRQVCTNGLIKGESLNNFKLSHTGNINQDVPILIDNIMSNYPTALEEVKQFQAVRLSNDEKIAFAKAAIELVAEPKAEIDNSVAEIEPKKENFEIEPTLLISPRRTEDKEPTLWNAYNTIQEKLINGSRIMKDTNRYTYQTKKKRAVTSITENVRLNKALWTLTAEMARLKTA